MTVSAISCPGPSAPELLAKIIITGPKLFAIRRSDAGFQQPYE